MCHMQCLGLCIRFLHNPCPDTGGTWTLFTLSDTFCKINILSLGEVCKKAQINTLSMNVDGSTFWDMRTISKNRRPWQSNLKKKKSTSTMMHLHRTEAALWSLTDDVMHDSSFVVRSLITGAIFSFHCSFLRDVLSTKKMWHVHTHTWTAKQILALLSVACERRRKRARH